MLIVKPSLRIKDLLFPIQQYFVKLKQSWLFANFLPQPKINENTVRRGE